MVRSVGQIRVWVNWDLAASYPVPFVVSKAAQIRRSFFGNACTFIIYFNICFFLPLKYSKNQKYRRAEAGCGGGRILGTGRNGRGSEERWDCIQKAASDGLDVEGQGCR